MTETNQATQPTMTRDAVGAVVHDKLAQSQARVDELEQKLETADARSTETKREVKAQQGLIAGLQSSIQSGNVEAADKHSQASAELVSMQRDEYNYDQARFSLRAQLADARVELDLNTAIYGHTDIISEHERAQELADAQMKVRAILEPIVRKYRKSDAEFYKLADGYQRYVNQNPQGLQGVSKIGSTDRVDSLNFSDGTKLDAMGRHHAERVTERAMTNINADLLAERRSNKAQRD